MLILNKIKNMFPKKETYSSEFESNRWVEEQVLLGKVSGVDTSVYNHSNISPTLMECARKQLELGSAPSSIKRIVDAYLNNEIDENEFEDLCEDSVYVIDLDYLKDKFRVITEPEELPKSYKLPTAFYGTCFGDIAGSIYEFGYNIAKRKELHYSNCIGTGSQPTDDTILSCATAVTLNEDISFDTQQELTLADYHRESCHPFICNPFTKKYREYAKKPFTGASYGSGFYSWVHTDSAFPYGSYGNGSAMRVSPIAEVFEDLDDIILYSIASAAATHNHMEGITGAVVVSVAIWMAKHGYSKKQIFDYMIGFYPEERTKKYIYRGVALKKFTMAELNYATGPTLCQYSVPAAAICFFYADNFDGVINNVLSFDGDTDTIGAIAGGIAGAYYGIPEYAKKIVEDRKPKDIFDAALEVIRTKKEA